MWPGDEVMVNARLVPQPNRQPRLPYIASLIWHQVRGHSALIKIIKIIIYFKVFKIKWLIVQADPCAATAIDMVQNLKDPIDPQVFDRKTYI